MIVSLGGDIKALSPSSAPCHTYKREMTLKHQHRCLKRVPGLVVLCSGLGPDSRKSGKPGKIFFACNVYIKDSDFFGFES